MKMNKNQSFTKLEEDDFEIINNCCDTELINNDGYSQLKNEVEFLSYNHLNNFHNYQSLNFNNQPPESKIDKNDFILNKINKISSTSPESSLITTTNDDFNSLPEKISLNSLQEKIHCNNSAKHLRNKQNSKGNNFQSASVNISPEESGRSLETTDLLRKLTIKLKNEEKRSDEEENYQEIQNYHDLDMVDNSNNFEDDKTNLPEIVLTAFEKGSNETIREIPLKRSSVNKFQRQNTFNGVLPIPSHPTPMNKEHSGGSTPISLKSFSSSREQLQQQQQLKEKRQFSKKRNKTFLSLLKDTSSLDQLSETVSSERNLTANKNVKEIPADLKCKMCNQIYKDPRTLNCLHSFCFQCIVNENFVKDFSIPFWSRPDGSSIEWKGTTGPMSVKSSSAGSAVDTIVRAESPSSISSTLKSKKLDKRSKDRRGKHKKFVSSEYPIHNVVEDKTKFLVCSVCQVCTEIPVGGIRQLPQNFLLIRKIEKYLFEKDNETISNIWCCLCCVEISATYHCISCGKSLCGFCKEAHERQKSTSMHIIKNLLELRKTQNMVSVKKDKHVKTSLKCSLHPGFELRSFCLSCDQVACSDCMALIHKGHKFETVQKAFKIYQKQLKDSVEKVNNFNEYVKHSIIKLGNDSKMVNEKCDRVQQEVERFTTSYFEAVEVHKNTLLQQIARARNTKMEMILEQQVMMETKCEDIKRIVDFYEELFSTSSSEIEVLYFVDMLLRRFEYCEKMKATLGTKVPDALHFLPEVRAPSTKAQNNIPLYGIITTQTVEPQYCTLETEGLTQLRIHRKVELIVLTRDSDSVPLCHGGLHLNAQVKYKEGSSKQLEVQVDDRRDGTYAISFTPDTPGTLTLGITINKFHIKDSPFTLIARTVRPHTGIFHCCTFCSSKGSKTATCACEGTMSGYKGCGHGHCGHPGRRHWSCCGSVLENSECSLVNRF